MSPWLSAKLRLLMEWITLPLLLTAMQLPHGAVLYWATSSGLALSQQAALRSRVVRAAVGLPLRDQVQADQPGSSLHICEGGLSINYFILVGW